MPNPTPTFPTCRPNFTDAERIAYRAAVVAYYFNMARTAVGLARAASSGTLRHFYGRHATEYRARAKACRRDFAGARAGRVSA